MRKFLTLATALLLPGAAAIASPPDDHPRFPINIEEATTHFESRFAAADTDADGTLSKDEFMSAEALMPPPGHGKGHGKGHHGAGRFSDAHRQAMEDAMFTALDTNGDGQLSRAENSRENRQAAKRTVRREHHFARLDANGDGRISRDELPDFLSRLRQADTDGDGQVTHEEMRAAHAARRAAKAG